MSKSEGIGESEASDSKYSNKLPDVTEEEEAEIREEFEEFVALPNCTSESALHLPSEDGSEYPARCTQVVPEANIRRVSPAIYPPGYRRICARCAAAWRENDASE